jgi:serine/threonine protein kinase
MLQGESLFERYEANGPLEWKRVVKIACAVCDSLEEAHGLGIVHRDLKPTNIHLERRGDDPDFVKVLDFGIAKILQGSDFDSGEITNAGEMIGTLDYMSPEQMVGGAVTGQTDIYTLGIVMYEVIAGCRPFPETTSAAAALAAMLKTTPQSLFLRAPVPKELDRIVMRCLERETQRRYKTVGELRADLQRLLAAAPEDTSTDTVTLGLDVRDDEDAATTITPPPEKGASFATPRLERRFAGPAAEWTDEDEHAPTSAPGIDHDDDERARTVLGHGLASRARSAQVAVDSAVDVKTPRVEARRGDSGVDVKTPRVEARRGEDDVRTPRVEREAPRAATITRPPPPPSVPTPRPLESRHTHTPLPQLIVAPFSSTPRTPVPGPEQNGTTKPLPAGALATPMPGTPGAGHGFAQPPGFPATPIPHAAMTPRPGLPATPIPHAIPTTPLPGLAAAPPPTAVPATGFEMGRMAAREAMSSYDMGRMAAREALIRRLVWIIALVVAVGAAVFVATLL